jgi:Flp pilus assembly protein TadG
MRRLRDASSRGSAAVEFALVLPLVFGVTLGLVQVGVLARDRALVEAAARAGARAAAVEPDEGAIRSAATAAAPGLDASSLALGIQRAGTRGDPVTVTVTYDDPIRIPFIGWLVGSSVHFDASAVMRQEFG